MKPSQLRQDEYAQWYAGYIAQLDESDLIEELEISLHRLIHYVREIPMDKFDFRYAPGKWTIKDILLHLIDAERVFAYRALRFARNDQTALPGFDENLFVETSNANARSIQDLLTELSLLRHSSIALFKSFDEQALLRIGTASGFPMSVRALGFVIIGHQNHHQRIFTERYLSV